jgi:hypothetical protein
MLIHLPDRQKKARWTLRRGQNPNHRGWRRRINYKMKYAALQYSKNTVSNAKNLRP